MPQGTLNSFYPNYNFPWVVKRLSDQKMFIILGLDLDHRNIANSKTPLKTPYYLAVDMATSKQEQSKYGDYTPGYELMTHSGQLNPPKKSAQDDMLIYLSSSKPQPTPSKLQVDPVKKSLSTQGEPPCNCKFVTNHEPNCEYKKWKKEKDIKEGKDYENL